VVVELPEAPPAPPAKLTRARLIAGAVVSSTICGVLALIVALVLGHPVTSLFASQVPIAIQIGVGLIVGGVLGSAGLLVLLRLRIFAEARVLVAEAAESARPGAGDLTLMALAAGVGEELLFRGTLQPAWGLAVSSLVFTAVHFWVPIRGAARACYIVFVLSVSLVLGLLFQRLGLGSSIVAHATVDLVILLAARQALRRESGMPARAVAE
jgi:CAAX protease family protein